MRSKERRDSGQNDLFTARLDQIVDMGHALARLAETIDWRFLEERFGSVYSDKPSQPPLPTRLLAGLSILKHAHQMWSDGKKDDEAAFRPRYSNKIASGQAGAVQTVSTAAVSKIHSSIQAGSPSALSQARSRVRGSRTRSPRSIRFRRGPSSHCPKLRRSS